MIRIFCFLDVYKAAAKRAVLRAKCALYVCLHKKPLIIKIKFSEKIFAKHLTKLKKGYKL